MKPLVNKKLRETDGFGYYLAKKVGKTIKKYGMLEENDRVLVGVSGGKDSLTLLNILHDRMGFYPNKFDLLALHVASNLRCEGLADPELLENYFKKGGYRYRIVEMHIEPDRKGPGPYWCSRNRRRVLFDTAIRLGYNKIALGHHRNDVLETFLLNVFYHAEISTMLPVQELFEGKVSIIRPLYAIPERDTSEFARRRGLPAVQCRCAADTETRREMFKRMLSQVERANPKAGINGLRALENVNTKYMPVPAENTGPSSGHTKNNG